MPTWIALLITLALIIYWIGWVVIICQTDAEDRWGPFLGAILLSWAFPIIALLFLIGGIFYGFERLEDKQIAAKPQPQVIEVQPVIDGFELPDNVIPFPRHDSL